ncbi:class II aldolase/adducin family protein [Paraburkholderia megapolitana]|uniref:class II aldolase/adducin family protein n=1 Tax=Paraburkholderia megapolitana TaxID=420953 RepID=UPI0011872DDE|nr:class II aldolase/adducin family protein [Paraburkholderia megapolitana]QDQ83682.1 class II aldolase/adducin family protein [Paraburkholderia megapolitana]
MTSSHASLKNDVSPAEWETRVNLAATYRLTALFGWDDLVFTISQRACRPEHHFLINPYGMMFDEITASSLIKIDLDGRKVSESPYDINPAGFTIHSAVHAAREDALCVMHTHSINGVAVSAQEGGLLPLSQQSLGVLASLGYHDYEGIALNEAEKPRLVHDLGSNTNLMLRNHGLLTVGATPADAFVAMYFFEAACMIQVRAQAVAQAEPYRDAILEGIKQQIAQVTKGTSPGRLVWPGLLRRLDRRNPGYAD